MYYFSPKKVCPIQRIRCETAQLSNKWQNSQNEVLVQLQISDYANVNHMYNVSEMMTNRTHTVKTCILLLFFKLLAGGLNAKCPQNEEMLTMHNHFI